MAETANGQSAKAHTGQTILRRLREAPFAAAAASFSVLAAVYLGSALISGDPRPLTAYHTPFGLEPVVHTNLVTIALIAYTIAVGLLESRSAVGELGQLRAITDCDDETFAVAARASFPSRRAILLALTGGGVLGLGVNGASWLFFYDLSPRDLHSHMNNAFMFLMFALLGVLALWGVRSAAFYSSISRRYGRVRLLEPESLGLFARRGLRLALYWFGGSALALLLVFQSRGQELVLGLIGLTVAIGLVSLILPSLGIHQRVVETKNAELARVRGEIESRLTALRGGDRGAATELPALLAWEARVSAAREWPLGGRVLIRFALLVLLPLGSWLGGALVERLVDGLLG